MAKSTKKTRQPKPKSVTVVDLLHKDNIERILDEVHKESLDIDRIIVIYEKHSTGEFKLFQAGISNQYEQIGFLEWAKGVGMDEMDGES